MLMADLGMYSFVMGDDFTPLDLLNPFCELSEFGFARAL
jgi:hypothetical protein